jgi:hypothetical protein
MTKSFDTQQLTCVRIESFSKGELLLCKKRKTTRHQKRRSELHPATPLTLPAFYCNILKKEIKYSIVYHVECSTLYRSSKWNSLCYRCYFFFWAVAVWYMVFCWTFSIYMMYMYFCKESVERSNNTGFLVGMHSVKPNNCTHSHPNINLYSQLYRSYSHKIFLNDTNACM